MEKDYSTNELLDRYPFSPLGVAGHPKNCIPRVPSVRNNFTSSLVIIAMLGQQLLLENVLVLTKSSVHWSIGTNDGYPWDKHGA